MFARLYDKLIFRIVTTKHGSRIRKGFRWLYNLECKRYQRSLAK